MAINRITGPNSIPTVIGDYQAQNNLIAALANLERVPPYSGTSMTVGYTFNVGGTIYRVDTTTSITGGTEGYLKITPSGATATASFVTSLSGVSWNNIYGGYYDVSGNRYIYQYTPGDSPIHGGTSNTSGTIVGNDNPSILSIVENSSSTTRVLNYICNFFGKIRMFYSCDFIGTTTGSVVYKKNSISIVTKTNDFRGYIDIYIAKGDILSMELTRTGGDSSLFAYLNCICVNEAY